MACLFTSPGCNGASSPPPHCAYCQELAKDDDLMAMAAIFPLTQVRAMLEPRVKKAARAPMADVLFYPPFPSRPQLFDQLLCNSLGVRAAFARHRPPYRIQCGSFPQELQPEP